MSKTIQLVQMMLNKYGKIDEFDQTMTELQEAGLLRKNVNLTKTQRVSKKAKAKAAKKSNRKISAYNIAVWHASKNIPKEQNVFSALSGDFWEKSPLNPKGDNFNEEELDKITAEYKEAKGISDDAGSDSEGSQGSQESELNTTEPAKPKRKPSAYNKFVALHKESRPEGVNMFDYVKEIWAESEYNKKSDNFKQESLDKFMSEE